MLDGAQGSLSVPEDSVWHVAGAGRGGLGSLILTMSEARGSGRLAPGEILAAGDILCPSFSVGGKVMHRPGWEMAQPCPEAPWPGMPPPHNLTAPSPRGPATAGWSLASSWPPGSFSVLASQGPGEVSSGDEEGSEEPSLHRGLGLSPEGREGGGQCPPETIRKARVSS